MAFVGRLFSVLLAVGLASSARAHGGSVIESRGEASYRIPIVVPPGPGGHQPDLALVYSSGEGRGPAGWLGFGWSLAGESRIERETRTGSPYDYDNLTCGTGSIYPCYRAAYTLDGQDLICSTGTCSTCTSGSPCRYRTQSDDGRIIHFKGATAGWEIQDRDGRTLVYGASSAGRLLNPANGSGEVFSWQLESYGARFYNPKWGRFVSPDEMVQGFDSQGLNAFGYVLNGPTYHVDPTGRMIQAIPAFVVLTIAFLPVLYFAPQAGQDLAQAIGEVAGQDSSDADDCASGGEREGAGRNEPHGDAGRAQKKAAKAIEKLKEDAEKLKGKPGSGRKIEQIRQKIKNITRDAAKKSKGETHHR